MRYAVLFALTCALSALALPAEIPAASPSAATTAAEAMETGIDLWRAVEVSMQDPEAIMEAKRDVDAIDAKTELPTIDELVDRVDSIGLFEKKEVQRSHVELEWLGPDHKTRCWAKCKVRHHCRVLGPLTCNLQFEQWARKNLVGYRGMGERRKKIEETHTDGHRIPWKETEW